MNIELEMLNAKVNAFRNLFLGLLATLIKDPDRVWLNKFHLWMFERDLLAPLDFDDRLPSPEKEKIYHRRFQLQVLMTVAYIQCKLEQFEIPFRIPPQDRELASKVFELSDGSEDMMIRVIDQTEEWNQAHS